MTSSSRIASFSLMINGYKIDFYDRQGIYQGDYLQYHEEES